MNVLDLFSGIGGFSLGLERAGMRTVAFCEIDPYCRQVLARHWPNVPICRDIRGLQAKTLADSEYDGLPTFIELGGASNQGRLFQSEGRRIDVICGGFPCQDISFAGKGAGITGERSGLWKEYARIIGEVRPRYVIVENVSALLSRGLGDVLQDLAALRYDAEWHCIPASAIGAPHRRDRIWIVAYPNEDFLANAAGERCGKGRGLRRDQSSQWLSRGRKDVPDSDRPRLSLPWSESLGTNGQQSWRVLSTGDWWAVEPDVGRVAHGVPARVDRLRSLGNAVVPQITEIIGRAIMSITQTS